MTRAALLASLLVVLATAGCDSAPPEDELLRGRFEATVGGAAQRELRGAAEARTVGEGPEATTTVAMRPGGDVQRLLSVSGPAAAFEAAGTVAIADGGTIAAYVDELFGGATYVSGSGQLTITRADGRSVVGALTATLAGGPTVGSTDRVEVTASFHAARVEGDG